MSATEFRHRYLEILSSYVKTSEERYLLMAADLGRELVVANVPPEDIAEIHEFALAEFSADTPDSTIAETGHLVSAPLMELLMAYGMAFRQQLESRKTAEDVQRLRNEQLQALTNIASILAGPGSLEEKENTVLDELAELMQADAIIFRRINDAGTELVLAGQAGPFYESYTPENSPKLTFQAFLSGETIVENNYPASGIATRFVLDFGIRSGVIQPVRAHGQVYGVLNVTSKDLNHFTEDRVQVLAAISDGLGVLLENARLYEEAKERAREIQRLNDYTNRILDSNPSALAVLNGYREVLFVNRSFCEAWGLDEGQVVGKPISQILPLVGLNEIIGESLSSRPEDALKEMKYLSYDGSERWMMVSAVPLLASDQADPGEESLLVFSDITEQKQQQERMEEHSRLASVGELAAGVAHEINNPLAAILGLSELIQMENSAPQAADDAKKIQDAAQRAAKIVQNLLFFARKHEPEKRYLEISTVVDRAIELKSHDLTVNNIQVTAKHSDGVPLTMLDELQLTQVILNILTNAQQAIMERPGPGEITATTQFVDGKIRLSIADDGPGILPENLRNIFDPFFTTKQIGQGTGLGLSICYGIIREHGGELWAESKPGEGASFHIDLPLVVEDVSTEAS